PPDRSFYFRGPAGALNLRASNLVRFVELAEGVDEPTWAWHLGQHDYSTWARQQIKDEDLAGALAAVETADLPPAESRRRALDEPRRSRARLGHPRLRAPAHFGGGLVDAEAEEDGVAQAAVARLLHEADLPDQRRLEPRRVPHPWRVEEGRRRAPQRREPL